MTEATAAVTMRIVLWPTAGDVDFQHTGLERPLEDATPEEARFFAAEYADIPLLELWRRLARAEGDAKYYRREAERWQEISRKAPPLALVRDVDARHKRIKALLAEPGRISRDLLIAALAETDDAWNARKEAS